MCEWSHMHGWSPFLRWGIGRCGETQVGYGIPISGTKHHHWVWMGLWSHSSVGLIMPSLLQIPRGGSPQTCSTDRHKCRLAIHLHIVEQHCVLCTTNKWKAHQCYDRWCTQHGHPWPASSAADMETATAPGEGSVPRGLKWGARGPTVSLSQSNPSGMKPHPVSPSGSCNF